jgi:hypothetical protein
LNFKKESSETKHPKTIQFSHQEDEIISSEITRLLEKGVVATSEHEIGELISTVFVRPKADGSHRLILNLNRLNKHVAYNHFKMESLKSL